jgi:hypothetical protein
MTNIQVDLVPAEVERPLLGTMQGRTHGG